MEVLILMTSHFKPSGHNHLQDIRPYFIISCAIRFRHTWVVPPPMDHPPQVPVLAFYCFQIPLPENESGIFLSPTVSVFKINL
jgi:hypothetical protein